MLRTLWPCDSMIFEVPGTHKNVAGSLLLKNTRTRLWQLEQNTLSPNSQVVLEYLASMRTLSRDEYELILSAHLNYIFLMRNAPYIIPLCLR